MKKQFTVTVLILMFLGCSAFGQIVEDTSFIFNTYDTPNTIKNRYVKLGSDSFCVRYQYNDGSWMDTLVGRMVWDSTKNTYVEDDQGYIDNRHYFATVSVYKIIICRCIDLRYDYFKIGNDISGTYVPVGCFEDRPLDYINEALKNKKQ